VTDLDARPTRRNRWAFLLGPGWVAAAAGAVAFAATCFFLLAPWQFSRHEERSAQNAAIQAALTAAPAPVTDLMSTAGQPPEAARWRVVTATGTFDPDRQVQVRLRQDSNGNPVSEVITPFRLESGQWLLVDRGYVRFADVSNDVPIAAPPAGTVTISGRVQDEQVDPLSRQPVQLPNRVEAYAINVGAVGGARPGEQYLQGYVQLTGESPGALTPVDVPQTDAGPFLSYALQWAAFGVIALIGFGVFVYREAFAPRPPDDRDRTGDGPDGPADPRTDPITRPSAGPSPDPRAVSNPPVPAGRQRRRARDGFDRSQLYDQ
jgi:cytochrome oxidase assembly protein ShyY1